METLKRKIDLHESYGEESPLSETIDHKLSEFKFFTADEKKGKSKITFTEDDRKMIASEFKDLKNKYNEDEAFVRAVVFAKGMDKKTNEPVVRLGSYDTRSDIRLFPSAKGLESVLDLSGTITYFTIINKDGPDDRDFNIEKGDNIENIEFKKEPENETPMDSNILEPKHKEVQKPEKPFEMEMKEKENRGLGVLREKGSITNELTKRQKKVLRELKRKGYKFKKPENGDIYERVRITSKEFNESINAWKPKKQ